MTVTGTLPFIVAEISKNWPDRAAAPQILAQQFEEIINFNYGRGYVLQEFRLSQVRLSQVHLDEDNLVETIVAVFRHKSLDRDGLPQPTVRRQ